ncbi:MAG TPA: DUF2155 domain-containing protein [Rhizomicrobium sp.]|jgi:hypothetical protein|nr:DUF2155 domain-containing protein [Rhizomicrobium sp.]
MSKPLRLFLIAGAGLIAAGGLMAALAQTASVPMAPAPAKPSAQAKPPAAPVAADPSAAPDQPPQPLTNAAGTVLMLRGLDKITGRPTDISAPIGKEVHFATLTITARYCYSTPASETPETSAFLQIEDHRPDQGAKRIFSGWMYASSPGLNGMQHPLYDVWVINCSNGAPNTPVAAMSSAAPTKVGSPDATDKEGVEALPEEAGR